jgi:hypothetical protein
MAFWTRKKGNELESSGDTPATGFDKAKELQVEDRLDRIRVSDRVFTLLTELPHEWSVRVGLLGSWGEGKTTVCNWIARRAQAAGHIVIWYNPWSARTLSAMWIDFTVELMRALDAVGIEVEGSVLLRTKLGYQKWSEAPRQAAQAHAFTKAGFGLLDTAVNLAGLLRVGPNDIKRIKEKLGDRRIVVIIDDLDRTDPSLLPQLLISLREILDVPGFSFLLPFDDTVVARVLTQHNPSVDGTSFLEKILDFRVRLPLPTQAQLEELFAAEMQRHCPFIPASNLAALFDLLPQNPRRLKALVRNLVPFRAEAARHKADEVDWRSVLFGSLIRMESEQFYHAYVDAIFSDSEKNPWLHYLMSKHDKEDETDKLLEGVLGDTVPDNKALRKRLRSLCNRWRDLNGLQNLGRVRYALKMIDQPDTLTWAEYDTILEVWRTTRAIEEVGKWIEAKAASQGYDVISFARDLLSTAISAYSERLEAAASALLEEEHDAAIDQAFPSFELFTVLARGRLGKLDIGLISPSLLEQFLNVVMTWAHFRGNPSDLKVREAESAFLTVLFKGKIDDWERYLGVLLKSEDRSDSDAMRKVIADLLYVLDPQIEKQSLDRFTRDGGIIELLPYEAAPEIKKRILDPSNAIWTPAGTSRVESLLETASENTAVQKNAIAILNLLSIAAKEGGHDLDKLTVKGMIENKTLMRSIWNAAIVRPFQFRKLKGMRELRQELIQLGADESVLSMPAWLLKGVR